MSANEMRIGTAAGDIALIDTGGRGPVVLMIHGNSCCKEVWQKQYAGEFPRRYRMIAIDLPGHGASSDAANPAEVYSMPGYARTVMAVLGALGVDKAAMVGWSLGGHIGIEMMHRFPGMVGLLMIGTPPVSNTSPEAVMAGFHMTDATALVGQEELSAAEAEEFARGCMGYEVPLERFVLDAVRRTDGRARALMLADFLAGNGVDQRSAVETSRVPIAIVNGAAEPFINNDYIRGVRFGNLWSGGLHLIAGAGHAPFWSAQAEFDAILERFLADVS